MDTEVDDTMRILPVEVGELAGCGSYEGRAVKVVGKVRHFSRGEETKCCLPRLIPRLLERLYGGTATTKETTEEEKAKEQVGHRHLGVTV
jgi:hypothetical protein